MWWVLDPLFLDLEQPIGSARLAEAVVLVTGAAPGQHADAQEERGRGFGRAEMD